EMHFLCMLFTCAQQRGISHLLTHVDSIPEWGELLQMVVLELIRKVCSTNHGDKGKFQYTKDYYFLVKCAF
ncbi:hypothetical protein MKW92_046855, partial [Papaver armeniacum]